MEINEIYNVYIIVKHRSDNKNDIREILEPVVASEIVANLKVQRLNEENTNSNMKYSYIKRLLDIGGIGLEVNK